MNGERIDLGDALSNPSTFKQGELRTGDLGLMVGDDLYVTGRADDLIVIGGRNVRAGAVEAELSEIAGLRAGCCALVDPRDGSGEAWVMAEIEFGIGDRAKVAARIKGLAREVAGIPIRHCILLDPGELPKTSSGKVQRFRCREMVASRCASL